MISLTFLGTKISNLRKRDSNNPTPELELSVWTQNTLNTSLQEIQVQGDKLNKQCQEETISQILTVNLHRKREVQEGTDFYKEISAKYAVRWTEQGRTNSVLAALFVKKGKKKHYYSFVVHKYFQISRKRQEIGNEQSGYNTYIKQSQ